MEKKTSSQTKARFIVVTVFVIGFLAGALSLNLYQQITSSKGKNGNGPRNGAEFLIRRMDQQVGLTTDQQDHIRKILDETNEKYREIRGEMEPRIKDFEPRFNAVREESRDRIRSLLTPEQLPKYQKMIEERDRVREQEREQRNKK